MSNLSHPDDRPFLARLEQARTALRGLLDLTEADPSRCGLAWKACELEDLLSEGGPGRDPERGLREAREAISSYLAGRGASVDPGSVVLSSSREESYAAILDLLCRPDDEVLIPSPTRAFLDGLAGPRSVRLRRYPLVYDGGWRIDRKALKRMITPRTRAIVIGNPSDPTGAALSADELASLEDVCSVGEVALVGDEALADTAVGSPLSVCQARECLALHVSGLSGVCGLPQLHCEWLAAAGPAALVAPAASRLQQLREREAPSAAQVAIPRLLARRGRYLSALRVRLSDNRSYLAAAALREAPWSLQWGAGGCWAVLQIGAAEEEQPLCLALLEDDGVAVQPGSLHGLPGSGFLVVSLLPEPAIFREGMARLDRRLRAPLLR